MSKRILWEGICKNKHRDTAYIREGEHPLDYPKLFSNECQCYVRDNLGRVERVCGARVRWIKAAPR